MNGLEKNACQNINQIFTGNWLPYLLLGAPKINSSQNPLFYQKYIKSQAPCR
jgi:hypothetical protein